MQNINERIRSPERSGSIGFSIVRREDDRVVSRMAVQDGVRNPFGTVQAGAIVWLADVTASVLAIGSDEIGPDGEGFPLAIDLHTTLLANQREGEIEAEARYLRRSRRVIVIRTTVTGDGGRVLAEVTSTHVPASSKPK
jgi:1,4-dihydroxy-2-naphthoyl-CoA hydrolase